MFAAQFSEAVTPATGGRVADDQARSIGFALTVAHEKIGIVHGQRLCQNLRCPCLQEGQRFWPSQTYSMQDEKLKDEQTADPSGEMLEFVTQSSDSDSNGAFTEAGKEAVEKVGECLRGRPGSWLLLAVQLANSWHAKSLALKLFPRTVQMEFTAVGDQRDWLDELLPELREGRIPEDLESELAVKMLWSALSQEADSLVLVAGGEQAQQSRAVRVGLKGSQIGEARLAPHTFLVQIGFQKPLGQEYSEQLLRQLHLFACSDRTLVTGQREIDSFFPLSMRRPGEDPDYDERVLEVGLWAMTGEGEGPAIHLGRSFADLSADGVKRRELTSGVFRTGLVGGKPAENELAARSVVCFTHHLLPSPSRIVWLSNGVEVAHQALELEEQPLAVTVYKEVPQGLDWDIAHSHFKPLKKLFKPMLKEVSEDLGEALQAMVGEYNKYSPGMDGATLGCWTFLILGCLAAGGVAAPFLGSKLAAPLSLFLALLLVRAEYRFRHKERYAVGQGLKFLAEELEAKKGKQLVGELLTPEEEAYPQVQIRLCL